MDINNKKKIPYLVVDTSAFIKSAALQEIGENIITVPEVLNEIKNKRQLRRLIVLPYDLQVKDVFPENIKFVNEFSKKTGDFTSLSATDVAVMALTYQMEKELNGASHLNVAPVHKTTIEPFHKVSEDLTNIAGFHIPMKSVHHPKKNSHHQPDEIYDHSDSDSDEFVDAREELELALDDSNKSKKQLMPEMTNEKLLKKNFKNITLDTNSDSVENDSDYVDDSSDDDDDDDGEDEGEDEDDDNNDWITPSNVDIIKNKIASDLIDDLEGVTVACLTTDYAMQNVLKQIGLHVVSLDGKLIKQLRTFILRCYGCFKTTSIMTKIFCPNCGNKTLKKVAVSLDADGTQHVHINFRKPLTARGKRFSLPRPKGGKHSNNPILCEDQPMPQQKPSRLSRTKNNPLNDDYIAGYSPFVMRDVTSKSAMLGIKPHIELKHQMRCNPNARRKFKK